MAALTTPPPTFKWVTCWGLLACVRVGYVANLLLCELEITWHACHDHGLQKLTKKLITYARVLSWHCKGGHSRVAERSRLTSEGGYPGRCKLFFRSTHGARTHQELEWFGPPGRNTLLHCVLYCSWVSGWVYSLPPGPYLDLSRPLTGVSLL